MHMSQYHAVKFRIARSKFLDLSQAYPCRRGQDYKLNTVETRIDSRPKICVGSRGSREELIGGRSHKAFVSLSREAREAISKDISARIVAINEIHFYRIGRGPKAMLVNRSFGA